jgi:hypothetical protein
MANLQVKDGAAATKYMKTDGAGTSGDPHVSHFVLDSGSVTETNSAAIKAAVELLDNAISGNEILIAGGATQTNDVKVTLDSEDVTSGTADNFKADANLQVGDSDVANGNPVPVSDAGGSLTVDGTVAVSSGSIDMDSRTTTPTMYNVTLTNPDTEYSQAMPTDCRLIEFQARTSAAIRFAFVTGKVATPTAPYMTLKAGDYYFTPVINQGASPSTLYLASSVAATVVEIIAWT